MSALIKSAYAFIIHCHRLFPFEAFPFAFKFSFIHVIGLLIAQVRQVLALTFGIAWFEYRASVEFFFFINLPLGSMFVDNAGFGHRAVESGELEQHWLIKNVPQTYCPLNQIHIFGYTSLIGI
jgi:hypothetical protein